MKSDLELLKAFGDRLKELRIKKGYTNYEAFANDYDLGRAQYWRLEKGESNPTLRTIIKVAAIHNLNLKDFFSEGF